MSRYEKRDNKRREVDFGTEIVTYTKASLERFESHAGRIQMALASGAWGRAHELVAQAEADARMDQRGRLRDEPLVGVIDVREANSLEKHLGALTVGDVLRVPLADLLAVPNMGETRAMQMLQDLASFSINRCEALEAQHDIR